MKTFVVIVSVVLFSVFGASAQIKELYLTCDMADFQYIYANYEQNIYIPATLEYNGTTWNNISIRIRGDGSRQYPKKSLKVKFNTGAYIDGRTTFNLNAEWEDQTYLQQFLASRLMRESGQPCFTAEHVRLYLNGSFFGLYLLNEAVNERFFTTRGMDPDGTTYKAALDGSSLSIFDQPQYHWEQKTGPDLNMADLQELIDEINAVPQADYGAFVDQAFVRSEVVNMIAMNELLALGSTYYHNYFMYHEPTSGKWMMLPWDMDKTLLYYGFGFPYHRSSRVWEPDNPYHEKAIHDDAILSEIRTRVEALESTIFNLSHIQPIIDSVQNAISNSVAEDTTDDVSGLNHWNTKINDYKNQFDQRADHLLGQIDEYPRNFTIDRIDVIEPNTIVELHWTPSVSPVQRPISYRFVFGDDPNLEASPIIVEANIADTLVSFTAPAAEGQYYYKVQAYDGFNYVDGFDSYNPLICTSEVPELVINEINYNSSPLLDTEDWVEIHNPLSYAVSLNGWTLKDDQNDHVFTFPADAVVGAGEFILVCRDTLTFNALTNISAPTVGNLSFGFGNSGDAVRLFHSSGALVDEVNYSDSSPWPTAADGNGPTLELLGPELDNSDPNNWEAWQDRNGTPGAVNFTGTSIEENLTKGQLTIYPSPLYGEELTIKCSSMGQTQTTIEIIDVTGSVIFSEKRTLQNGNNQIMVNPELKAAGLYSVRIITTDGWQVRRFVYTGKQ